MYITQSGATEIDVVMQEGRLSPILTICVDGMITIDWGDGTASQMLIGNDLTYRLELPHTYAQAGAYTISISATEDNKYRFYGSISYALLRKNTTENENKVYASTIQHIRIGNNAEIGHNAFYNCHSLISITIPNSVTSLGNGVFRYCYSLLNVTIPDGITTIASNTFYYCTSLISITIPNGVTDINNTIFYGCYALASITIPDSVTSIGEQAFQFCYALASITIPDSVTSIGSSAFRYCYSLSNVTISNKLTTIESYIFANCSPLAIITIPDSVTSIKSNAFQNCHGVKEYHILPTTPPTAGTTIFDSISSDCIIYVPSASLNTYQTTSNWSTYASYMQGE